MNDKTDEKEFNLDFINAQKKIGVLEKCNNGHKYTYADLNQTIETIKNAIGEHKIGFMQHVILDAEKYCLVTTLIHVNGHRRDFIYPIIQVNLTGGANAGQEFGASVTYSKRYALQAIFGIATEDVDLNIKKVSSSKGYNKSFTNGRVNADKNITLITIDKGLKSLDSPSGGEMVRDWVDRQTNITKLSKKYNEISKTDEKLGDYILGNIRALQNGGVSE